jgi:hypothetical protein
MSTSWSDLCSEVTTETILTCSVSCLRAKKATCLLPVDLEVVERAVEIDPTLRQETVPGDPRIGASIPGPGAVFAVAAISFTVFGADEAMREISRSARRRHHDGVGDSLRRLSVGPGCNSTKIGRTVHPR